MTTAIPERPEAEELFAPGTFTCALKPDGQNPGFDCPTDDEIEALVASMGFDARNPREWILSGLFAPVQVTWSLGAVRAAHRLGWALDYGDSMGRMCRPGKRRHDVTPEELTELAGRWHEALLVMATSHDPEAVTRMDETTEDLLRPLLTMPIEQVRSFTRDVSARLKADTRIPYLVWSHFHKLIEPMVLKGPDGKEVELAQVLAWEVAELALPKIEPEEWVAAIGDALQWRKPATLKRVKKALEAPDAKPRLRGRESCLFLELDVEDGEPIMVVL
jgi:hypothetical protein